MNIFQKIAGTLFPPYKFSVIRNEQGKLFSAIINSLPDEFREIKEQLTLARFMDLKDWVLFPDYKFVTMYYPGESLFRFKERGKNYKISGVTIFSKRTNKWEQIEILVHDNLINGLRVENSNYDLSEFDLSRIGNSNVSKADLIFPPGEIDKFYAKLPEGIKANLDPNRLEEIDFGNRLFYAFYDLEDGNYLAIDKKLNVYSLVHDARPMVKKMDVTFQSILDALTNGSFRKEQHLDERYGAKD